MRTITGKELNESPAAYKEITKVLSEGGLVCFPTRRQYAIAASLLDQDAVLRLVQAKRRTAKAPSLILIPGPEVLEGLVESVPEPGPRLMKALWPGPLTLLLRPGEDLPSKVIKTMGLRKKGKLGVRVCNSEPARSIVEAFGGPLLTSSANLAKKVGSSSVAQIRKNFVRTVDLLVDMGDLPAAPPSTIIDVGEQPPLLKRVGAISRERIVELIGEVQEP